MLKTNKDLISDGWEYCFNSTKPNIIDCLNNADKISNENGFMNTIQYEWRAGELPPEFTGETNGFGVYRRKRKTDNIAFKVYKSTLGAK